MTIDNDNLRAALSPANEAGESKPEDNRGYAICDAAMRRWVDPGLPVPSAFPCPRGV